LTAPLLRVQQSGMGIGFGRENIGIGFRHENMGMGLTMIRS
jgi:hypothetical protein